MALVEKFFDSEINYETICEILLNLDYKDILMVNKGLYYKILQQQQDYFWYKKLIHDFGTTDVPVITLLSKNPKEKTYHQKYKLIKKLNIVGTPNCCDYDYCDYIMKIFEDLIKEYPQYKKEFEDFIEVFNYVDIEEVIGLFIKLVDNRVKLTVDTVVLLCTTPSMTIQIDELENIFHHLTVGKFFEFTIVCHKCDYICQKFEEYFYCHECEYRIYER